MKLDRRHLRPDERPQRDVIGKKIDEALEEALLFLGSFGVWPKSEPKILHLDIDCPTDSETIAITTVNQENERKYYEEVVSLFVKAEYRYFGLGISDEALAEYLREFHDEKRISREPDLAPEYGNGEDITIFRGTQIRPEDLVSTLVHELWHLVEDQFGMGTAEPIISEGTATFVEKLHRGVEIRKPKIEDYNDVLYELGAWLVARELKKEKNPMKALLVLGVRRRIGQAFRKEALGLLIRKIDESYDPRTAKDLRRREIRLLPAFRDFRNDPCHETYLSALREQGFKKIAKEIATQDTRKLIRYMASLVDKKGRK